MQQSEEKIYTVTALTRLIKYALEESFPEIWVEGEVSNYIHHSSGHRYLVLKDENAVIKLTIWRSLGQYLRFEPENGMKVRAFGSVTVYEKGGNYQLNVRKLLPVGVGELEVAFRQLYKKLAGEGLFEESLKQPLPEYPMTIGIVTSPTGAAVRDIINIARRRNDSVKLILYPALVQGEGAAESIIAGINYFNSRDDIDVIIIGRGGGSLEDLWAFNEEPLVRAVVASKKPIVSGVGHEIDTTLADLAADLRAPTPSAAAELVIWDKRTLIQDLTDYLSQMSYSLEMFIKRHRTTLVQYMNRPVYQRPENSVREREQTLDNLMRHFENAGKNLLEKKKNILSLSLSRLESLSPLAILKRGYAVLMKLPGGETVKSVEAITGGDMVEAVLQDGSVTALIKEIKRA